MFPLSVAERKAKFSLMKASYAMAMWLARKETERRRDNFLNRVIEVEEEENPDVSYVTVEKGKAGGGGGKRKEKYHLAFAFL